jgi:hypothetical protein
MSHPDQHQAIDEIIREEEMKTFDVTYRSEWTTEVEAYDEEHAEEIAWDWVIEKLGNYFHLDHEEIEVKE